MPNSRLVIIGWLQKAVLSILAEVCGEDPQQKPNRKRKDKCVNTVSDVIMKQCRNVLHLAAAADKKMVFGSVLGGSLNISDDDDDEGLLQSPSMLSRPLDFRIIDMKLTSGAYGGSHDAFLEDVREVCSMLLNLFGSDFQCLVVIFKIFYFLLLHNSLPVCIYIGKKAISVILIH